MEFINLADKTIDKNNPDYDLETFWYGLKSLIKNYYNNITDDHDIKYTFSIELLSNKLNKLQKENKYEEIYDNIYLFFIKFLKNYINKYEDEFNNPNTSTQNYIFTWIKRFNKIKGNKKIELYFEYDKNKYFSNVTADELFYIKLKFIEYSLNNKMEIKYMKLLDNKKFRFLDECINNEYRNIFDFISLKYNLNDYFEKKEWTVKSPIKFIKLIMNNKEI